MLYILNNYLVFFITDSKVEDLNTSLNEASSISLGVQESELLMNEYTAMNVDKPSMSAGLDVERPLSSFPSGLKVEDTLKEMKKMMKKGSGGGKFRE